MTTTTITEATPVLVFDAELVTSSAPIWRGSLGEFERDNDFDVNTRTTIRRQLESDGLVIIGGGAAPTYRVEVD